MPAIVTCTCGARVRLPEAAEGRAFRCPKCKTELLATADARILTSTLAHGGTVGSVCPICQAAIQEGEGVVSCPDCDQVHHRECWVDVGGCSTYGCRQAPAGKSRGPEPAAAPSSAWGDTKKCPACGETIKAVALRCRYCGTDFHTVDPLTARDLRSQARQEGGLQTLRTTAVVLFVLSVLGFCLAPITLIASLALLLPKRAELARAGPFYQALGYSAIGVSGVFSILMIVFAVISP